MADLGWGASGATSATLSFWVKSSLTGTFGLSLLRESASTYRAYPLTYTINSVNTWEYKTVTITGDTLYQAAAEYTNGIGINISFQLGLSTGYQSSSTNQWVSGVYTSGTCMTQLVATNGATFQITGVQLEKGSAATAFENRQYGQELALCQRYLQVWGQTTSQILGVAWSFSTTGTVVACLRPVQMRASPTLTTSTISDWTVFSGSAGSLTPTAAGQNRTSPFSMSIEFTVASGLTAGQAGSVFTGNGNARLYESAEL
jgi:hypothetical protein